METRRLRAQPPADDMMKRGERKTLTSRRRGQLRLVSVLAGILVVATVILILLFGHAPAKSAEPQRQEVVAHVASRMTTVTYPALPASAPIYWRGVRLPSTLSFVSTSVKISILMFHAVAAKPIFGSAGRDLTVPTLRFEAEMDYLAKEGYTPVTLEELYAAMAGEAKLPAKPVALTFDDGYSSTYAVVLPILKTHHFVATFFVVTGVVGRPGFVTWAELRQMKAAGMAIESHTVHHLNLDMLSDAQLTLELTQSRAAIAAELGQVPAALSYPGGDYNQRVAVATKAAGYLFAVIAKPGSVLGPRNPYAWPRIGIGPKESLTNFAKAVEGIAKAKAGSVVHKSEPGISLTPAARHKTASALLS